MRKNLNAKGIGPIERQMLTLIKHSRAGSYATRARYMTSATVAARHFQNQFKLQNIKNLQDKHLASFIVVRRAQGISSKTISNDLAAIRYVHDMLHDKNKNQLSSNQEITKKFNLDRVRHEKVGNRAWSEQEVRNAIEYAKQDGRADIARAIEVSRALGLRIAEVVCMRRSQVENALRTGNYRVLSEAKNGRNRIIPVSNRTRAILEEIKANSNRGERPFAGNHKAHMTIKEFKRYLYESRKTFETL